MLDSAALRRNELLSRFALDVRAGLGRAGQKQMPSVYFYDAVGSALFEAITHLAEYGLTRADERLVQQHAHFVAESVGTTVVVAELGSGTGRKTRHLLSAIKSRYRRPAYYPIDVSDEALAACVKELDTVASVVPVKSDYLEGLETVSRWRRPDYRILVLFLGSTIGNFSREESLSFLRAVRALLEHGDALLLGTDLVKEADRMLLAYNDPTGVTAAFNRNLLARINRELGADFDLAAFEHEVRYNTAEQRVEMHLRSTRRQQVQIQRAGLDVSFRKGETIWTESAHKYDVKSLADMAANSGWEPKRVWVDKEWPFAESLWIAA